MALTATRIRPGESTGEHDEQGNPVPGASSTATIPIRAFAPRVSEELAEAFGVRVTDAGTIYADAGTDIRPSDRLLIDGTTWQVEGTPRVWQSPYGGLRGVEIIVRRSY